MVDLGMGLPGDLLCLAAADIVASDLRRKRVLKERICYDEALGFAKLYKKMSVCLVWYCSRQVGEHIITQDVLLPRQPLIDSSIEVAHDKLRAMYASL